MLGENLEDESEENANETKDEKSFYGAKVWKRMLIIAAGPGVNLLTTLIVSFFMIITFGVDKPIVSHVTPDTPAYNAGLQVGDEIIFYNSNKIANTREYMTDISLDGVPKQIEVVYKRDDEIKCIHFDSTEINAYRFGIQHDESNTILLVSEGSPAEAAGLKDGDTITSINDIAITKEYTITNYTSDYPLSEEELKIGYIRNENKQETLLTPEILTDAYTGFELNANRTKVSLPQAVKSAFGEVGYYTNTVIKSFGSLFKGTASVSDLSGPVGTVEAMGKAYDQATGAGIRASIGTIMNLTVLLSALLGVTNLLPIPAMDGCQLLIFTAEAVRGKPLNKKFIERLNFIGFMCLMGLLLFVTASDIGKLF